MLKTVFYSFFGTSVKSLVDIGGKVIKFRKRDRIGEFVFFFKKGLSTVTVKLFSKDITNALTENN